MMPEGDQQPPPPWPLGDFRIVGTGPQSRSRLALLRRLNVGAGAGATLAPGRPPQTPPPPPPPPPPLAESPAAVAPASAAAPPPTATATTTPTGLVLGVGAPCWDGDVEDGGGGLLLPLYVLVPAAEAGASTHPERWLAARGLDLAWSAEPGEAEEDSETTASDWGADPRVQLGLPPLGPWAAAAGVGQAGGGGALAASNLFPALEELGAFLRRDPHAAAVLGAQSPAHHEGGAEDDDAAILARLLGAPAGWRERAALGFFLGAGPSDRPTGAAEGGEGEGGVGGVVSVGGVLLGAALATPSHYYSPLLLTALALLAPIDDNDEDDDESSSSAFVSSWLRGPQRWRGRCRGLIDMGPVPGGKGKRVVLLRLRAAVGGEGAGSVKAVAALLGSMAAQGILVPSAAADPTERKDGGDGLPRLQVSPALLSALGRLAFLASGSWPSAWGTDQPLDTLRALAHLRLRLGVPFPARTGRLPPRPPTDEEEEEEDGNPPPLPVPPTAVSLTGEEGAAGAVDLAALRPCLLQGVARVFAGSPPGHLETLLDAQLWQMQIVGAAYATSKAGSSAEGRAQCAQALLGLLRRKFEFGPDGAFGFSAEGRMAEVEATARGSSSSSSHDDDDAGLEYTITRQCIAGLAYAAEWMRRGGLLPPTACAAAMRFLLLRPDASSHPHPWLRPYTTGLRAGCWRQLIEAEAAAGAGAGALAVLCRRAVAEEGEVTAGDAYFLRRRLWELEGSGGGQRDAGAVEEGGPLCPVRVIEAERDRAKRGKKAAYKGGLTVEQTVLQHYAKGQGPGTHPRLEGVHTEGRVHRQLWWLLLWDEIMDAAVPGAFPSAVVGAIPSPLSPCQLPIDIKHGPRFYRRRAAAIEGRLFALAAMIQQGSLGLEVMRAWDAHAGALAAADAATHPGHPEIKAWSLHQRGLGRARAAVIAVGLGHALIGVLRRLSQDHQAWSRGLPDLVLFAPNPATVPGAQDAAWFARLRCAALLALGEGDPSATGGAVVPCEARLVEVKGPGDSLSEHQKAWIADGFARMRVFRPERRCGGQEQQEEEEEGGASDDEEEEGDEETATPESEDEAGRAQRGRLRAVARRYPLFELARVEVVSAEGEEGGTKRRRVVG